MFLFYQKIFKLARFCFYYRIKWQVQVTPIQLFFQQVKHKMDQQGIIKVDQLPIRARGAYSNKFRKQEIVTNHFAVSIRPIDRIYIFKIIFTPKIKADNRAERQKQLNLAAADIEAQIQKPVWSGFNILSKKQPKTKQFSVKTETHQIKIKQVKIIQVKEKEQMLISFLNNAVRNMMSVLNYAQIGRTGKYFNMAKKIQIDKELRIYPGYASTFMSLQSGISLRVESVKKVVRNETVLECIRDYYRTKDKKTDRTEIRQGLKKQFINKIIMTNYGKTRYLKIIDVQFHQLQTFTITQQNIPIMDYFINRYNVKIEDKKQPLLVVEQKRFKDQKVYILPELCLMTGIPDHFDEFRRRKVSDATIANIDDRKKQISQFMDLLKDTPQFNYLAQMGIKIDQNLKKIQSKVIPNPRLLVGDKDRIPDGKQSYFQLYDKKIFNSSNQLNVGVIQYQRFQFQTIEGTFKKTIPRLGVAFNIVKLRKIKDRLYGRQGIKQIQYLVEKFKNKHHANIILIFLPKEMKSYYKEIKKICLIDNKIQCQVACQSKLYGKGCQTVGTKILLQMIAKMGNVLWVPDTLEHSQNLMLASFDTGKVDNKNILAGVATVNDNFSSMTSKTQQFTDLNNKYHTIKVVLLKLVNSYVKLSTDKRAPKQIILFSNSIPRDQISLYRSLFIDPFLDTMQQLFKENKPKLTVVLVNTKAQQRFFQSHNGTTRNVSGGTVVSSEIVSKNYDFFMISQYSHKGSSVANHYRVIYNDSKMEEGLLQQIIHNQCFNYANWNGSIKIPSIMQYAKKCAKFNCQVMEAQRISRDFDNSFYYI